LRLLATMTSGLKQRRRLLEEAVSALRRSGDRLELARALTDLGPVHRALGSSDRARSTVRQAHHVAVECRAESLLKRIRPNLCGASSAATMQVATEPDGISLLSEAELRVAALAARGRTNREIAKQLFITPSTVEQHLTRVYRKLRVRHRWDLPEELSLEMLEQA
ncbi:MAG TPA: helix-turn-helix transcriptional regulator, partial [Pseudonocardiaceae bacterium]|nr:helix-turn-helix transcriptional regulator [Pseudonocardiaceae bacterium]